MKYEQRNLFTQSVDMYQSCAFRNLRTPCKNLVSMRRTDAEVNPNLKPVERFSLNGRRDSESRLYNALNLPFKRLPKGRPGSDMVVRKEGTMLCSAKGGG